MTAPDAAAERSILRHPLFLSVLLLKLVAAALFGSAFVRTLFVPFVTWTVEHPGANPWDHFAQVGPVDAFPYSGAMLALLATPQALANLLWPQGVAGSEALRLLLIRLPLLGADLTIFAVLCAWFDTKRSKVLWLYWCSPILFYISYVHGQLDAIPTALLFLCLHALFRDRPLRAGALLGLGIAAKMHLLVAVPFLLVHLLAQPKGKRGRDIAAFSVGCAGAAALLIAPLLGSPGYRAMVLGTRETERLFQIALPISGALRVYLAPVVVVVLLLRYAAGQRSNQAVLLTFLALAFALLLLFVPPMPGWYFWAIPLCCCLYLGQESLGAGSLWLLSLLYLLYYLCFWNLQGTDGLLRADRIESLAFTALQGALAINVFWLYRVGLWGNEALRAPKSSLLIGIAGDSGTGKHTLGHLLEAVLGARNTLQTHGDDYHRWPRGHEAWRAFTQLSPQGNRIALSVEHAADLKRGEPIRKPLYDHATGLFTVPRILRPKRFVLFVGLHSFTVRRMRNLLDLRIYLDPDPILATRWKVQRDQRERGHTEAQVRAQIAAREADSRQYVQPQRQFADWIIRYRPLTEETFATRHLLWNDVALEAFVETVGALPGLKVSWDMESDLERQSVEVEGSLGAEQVRDLSRTLAPLALAHIGQEEPGYAADQNGVTQLLFLVQLEHLLRDHDAAGA